VDGLVGAHEVYSPKCVEQEFCDVRLVPVRHPKGSPTPSAPPSDNTFETYYGSLVGQACRAGADAQEGAGARGPGPAHGIIKTELEMWVLW
jgi:hypothetical protein